MTISSTIVEGVVMPDGTLAVNSKLDIPAGRVRVTVQSLPEPIQPERFWKMMDEIWGAQKAHGQVPRSREEIDAEIDALRNDAEDEMQSLERLQEECRRAREQPQGTSEDIR